MVGVTPDTKAPQSLVGVRNNTHKDWWRDAGLRKLNMWIVLIFLTSASIGYDSSLIGGLLPIATWYTDLGNPDTERLSLMIATQSIGSLAGLPLATWLPDRFGRKWTILVGNVIIIGGAVGQTFTNSSAAYIATRFIVGFGVVVAANGAPALATEIAHPRMFGRVASYYNVCFYAGSIIASWTTFATLRMTSSWNWRMPTFFQCIPALIQVIAMFKCPESPRFLVAKGREQEAKQTLLKYHANGAEQDDLVDLELSQIVAQHQIDVELERRGETGWAMFIRTPGMRKRLILILLVAYFSQWAGNGIISYYFAPVLQTVGITDPNAQAGLFGGLAIWNAFFAIGGASQVDRLGRRALWMIATAGMLVSYIIVTALSAVYSKTGSAGTGYGVIVMLFIFFAFYDIALTPLAVGYPVEILPYSARSKGMGILYFGIFSALVFNTYANPLALEAIGYYYYIVYIVILAVMLVVVYFYFPETRGKTLEEVRLGFCRPADGKISVIFDGDDATFHSAMPADGTIAGSEGQDEKTQESLEIHHVEQTKA